MNINQAHKEFQIFVDKVDSQSLPEFNPYEIDTFIHEAELRVIKQAYGGNNVYRTGFQQSQKRLDDISTLIRTSTIPFVNNEAILPTDYMFLARVSVQVQNEHVGPAYTTPYVCPHDKLEVVLRDPFNKSIISYPIVWQQQNKVLIDTPDFEAINARVTYIKYPRRVDKATQVHSELPEQKQREAIQVAVRIALGSISGDYQAQANEVNSVE